MKKTDGRHASPEAQREKRRIALRMKYSGYHRDEIARLVEVHPSTVSEWFKVAREKGEEIAVEGGKRGVRKGERRKLSTVQVRELKKMMLEHMPDELDLSYALWTRRAVIELIAKHYQVGLPLTTMGLYLKRWGFISPKPLMQDYDGQSPTIQKWLNEHYEEILERIKMEEGLMCWVSTTPVLQPPKRRAEDQSVDGAGRHAADSTYNMLAAVTNQGLVRFMLYTGELDMERLIDFCSRLIKDTDQKVFLALGLDRMGVCEGASNWFQQNQDQLELIFFPSPD